MIRALVGIATALIAFTVLVPQVASAATVAPQPVLVTLGDSITAPDAPGSSLSFSEQYPSLLAIALHAKLFDLGIGGETSFAHDAFDTNQGGLIVAQGGVLNDEVSKMPPDCAAAGSACIVTLYIGINDEWEYGMTQSPNYADPEATYKHALDAIVSGIRANAPQAKLYIATVPNNVLHRGDPYLKLPPQPTVVANFALVRSMKATIEAEHPTGVVDLLCEPGMYSLANFPDAYNVHPNADGQRGIFNDFLAQITNPTAPQPCVFAETAL